MSINSKPYHGTSGREPSDKQMRTRDRQRQIQQPNTAPNACPRPTIDIRQFHIGKWWMYGDGAAENSHGPLRNTANLFPIYFIEEVPRFSGNFVSVFQYFIEVQEQPTNYLYAMLTEPISNFDIVNGNTVVEVSLPWCEGTLVCEPIYCASMPDPSTFTGPVYTYTPGNSDPLNRVDPTATNHPDQEIPTNQFSYTNLDRPFVSGQVFGVFAEYNWTGGGGWPYTSPILSIDDKNTSDTGVTVCNNDEFFRTTGGGQFFDPTDPTATVYNLPIVGFRLKWNLGSAVGGFCTSVDDIFMIYRPFVSTPS